MLFVHNISKSFGVTPALSNISFNLNALEKIGLIGPNGYGKTTLLKILSGLEKADAGTFSITTAGVTPGYLTPGT